MSASVSQDPHDHPHQEHARPGSAPPLSADPADVRDAAGPKVPGLTPRTSRLLASGLYRLLRET